MDSEQTRVVFRVWKRKHGGGVLALFPDVDAGGGSCGSYEHVGQHGGAHYSGCIARTRPATPAEYADLKRELESAPYHYKLKVAKRR